eukprot:144965-Pyramimonas_sp.AAC.1
MVFARTCCWQLELTVGTFVISAVHRVLQGYSQHITPAAGSSSGPVPLRQVLGRSEFGSEAYDGCSS